MTLSPSVTAIHPAQGAVQASQDCGRARLALCYPTPTCVLIAVTGEIDATNRQLFGGFVESHIRKSHQLILDLSEVAFFGSQGFTALYYVSAHCARRDVDWALIGNRGVRRIVGICDPDGALPLADDQTAALARLEHLARRAKPVYRRSATVSPWPRRVTFSRAAIRRGIG